MALATTWSKNSTRVLRPTFRSGIVRCVVGVSFTYVDAPQEDSFFEKERSATISKETARWNSMLNVCAQARDRIGAEFIFFRAVKEKIEPNSSTFSALVSACAGACEAKRADTWVSRLIESGIQVDVDAYSAVIRACVDVGDLIAAENCLTKLKQRGLKPNVKTYIPLLRASSHQIGGTNRTEELRREMRDLNIKFDVDLFWELLSCYAAVGDWEQVESTLEEMRDAGWPLSASRLSVLVSACAKSEDVDRAEGFLERALQDGLYPSLTLINSMLKVCAQSRRLDKAQRWLKMTRERFGLFPDIITYNTFLNGCAKVGDISTATQTYGRIKQVGLKPDALTFTALIKTCAEARKGLEAEVWLKRMIRQGLEPDLIAFHAALDACKRSEEIAALWRVWATMQSRGVVPDAAVYTTLATPYAYRGDVEKVESIMESARSAGHRWQVREYSCMLSACANSVPRESEKAEQLFRELVSVGGKPNSHILRFLRQAIGPRRTKELCDQLGVSLQKRERLR